MTSAAVLAAGLSLAAGSLVSGSVDADLKAVEQAIDLWDVERAESASRRLLLAAPESADSHYLSARVRFLDGRYAEAMAELERAQELAPDEAARGRAKEFHAFVRPMAELAARFTAVESEHFRVHFVDGPDRVLVARAVEVLESAYRIMGDDFGIFPERKIRVEVFPDAESFQLASTLTKGEIETSGTIALCKFNRLMMMSPRLILRGFPWCDTLCHEYVHYVLWRRNGGTVPIWLHEGIAKYEEARWTGGPPSALTPLMQQVLKQALDDGEFVTFDQMHPSFAKLPGPHEVALASAEVLSVVHYVFDTGGKELLGKMLDALRDGAEWREMFEVALAQPFEGFWSSWQGEMKSQLALVKGSAVPDKLVELRETAVGAAGGEPTAPGAADPPGDAEGADEEPSSSSSRYVRLGALLHDRGLFRAAAVEYEKAVAFEGDGAGATVLMNRLASTYRKGGQLPEAVGAYRRSIVLDAEYAPTLTGLGLLHHTRGEAAEAIEALEGAARINPFDPRIHDALADIYGALGRERERARARVELEVLRKR